MTTDRPFDPDWVVCPGELVQEELDIRMTSLSGAAAALGLTPDELDLLLVGELVVTDGLADKLGSLFGTSSTIWRNLEASYRNGLARNKIHTNHPLPSRTTALPPVIARLLLLVALADVDLEFTAYTARYLISCWWIDHDERNDNLVVQLAVDTLWDVYRAALDGKEE